MLSTTKTLRFQVSVYVLLITSLLSGVLGLAGHAWQPLPVPESLTVTLEGAMAMVLGGLIILSLMMHWRVPRLVSGGLLLAIASYSILHNLLGGADDAGLPLLAGLPRLPNAPAAVCALLLAVVALLGLQGGFRRRFGIFVGVVGILFGGIALITHLNLGQPGDNQILVFGFTHVSALFCVGFGLLLIAICRSVQRETVGLSLSAALIGALGAVCTFVLLVTAIWGIHLERQRTASTAVHHQAAMLEHGFTGSAGLIGRLADRWTALELDIPEPLKQAELRRYFHDIPALRSLLALGKNQERLLHESKTAEEQLWMEIQLRRPEVRRWAGASLEQDLSEAWVIPDDAKPLVGILMVAPDGPEGGLFFAAFDIQHLLSLMPRLPDDELEISVTSVLESSPNSMGITRGSHQEIYGHATASVPGGPTLGLTAIGGPVSMLSLPGALVPGILIFGLFVSYLLAIGRSLAAQQRQRSRELSIEEQRFRSLFFQSPDAAFEFSKDGRYVLLNGKAKAITGLSDQDLGVLSYHDVLCSDAMSKRDYRTFDAAFKATIAGAAQTFSVAFRNADGVCRNYECAFVPVLVDATVIGLYAAVKDVTERLQVQENQRLLTKSLEASDSSVLVVDVRSEAAPIVFTNTAFSEMTGYSYGEVLGSSFSAIAGSLAKSEDIEQIRRIVATGEAKSFTVKSYRRDGALFWNQLSLTPIKDDEGTVTHYTAIMKDVSEKREQERQLAYQATHDVLTGLANRSLFEDRLEHDIALAKRNGEQLAVLFIDLDEFKPINDTLGHRIGDEVLISVARRLQGVIRSTDTLARFGGDEFVLLLPNLATQQDAELMADCVLSEVGQVHRVGPHELYVTGSIGISFLTDDLDVPARLLQQADMAMYKAKQQGKDTYVVYSYDLDEKLSRRMTLRNELQDAIKASQFFLHYQPQVDQHGRICGLEALVRWKHPSKGMVSPAEFIPVAEETGQIIHLGRWVTTQACLDARRLLDMGILQGRMAVNLSPLQFHRPGFLEALSEVLVGTRLPATSLELELTENILMRNSEGAIEILRELESRGIATSIDDFGTGYSSFSYLKDLPVHSVKIDKSFVDSVLSERRDAAVCKGVITMASEMGIKVVAEGVESREQFDLLDSYGCEVFQGFHIAKPMGFDKLVPWIRGNLADTTKAALGISANEAP